MKYSILCFCLLSFVFFLFSCQDNSDTEKLHTIFAEAWEHSLKVNPMFATRVGDNRYNHLLADRSLAAIMQELAYEEQLIGRLRTIKPEYLSGENKINYEIFLRLTEQNISEKRFRTYLMPITGRSGFHVYFPQLADDVPLNNEQDYLNYIARMDAFPEYAEQHIELMRRGIAEGMLLPAIVIAGINDALDPHIVEDAGNSLLFKPFQKSNNNMDDGKWETLKTKGAEVILTRVVPAYKKFKQFMNSEYLPAARKSIAASELPQGKSFYEYRVRKFTSLNLTPQEVHDKGLSEVARIRAEMYQILEDLKFSGDLRDFIRFLRTDPRFYVDTPEQLMKEVAYVLKKMDGVLPELFKTIPRMPYGIKKIPDFIAPRTTTAYYSGPAGDGTRAGFYFVNTYDLKSRPLYEIEALSLHEAVPGHHFQIALQQELNNLPRFRRFAGFTAFVEGWALYAERLGLETGFYQDPYSDFGRLTYEMWRACRLVVDTGMHYLGWTRQQAIYGREYRPHHIEYHQ